jgi:hypothetical protein
MLSTEIFKFDLFSFWILRLIFFQNFYLFVEFLTHVFNSQL